MSYRYRRQPFKGIYLIFQLFVTCLKLPLWILFAIPKSWRPRRTWSIKRVVLVKLFRHTLQLLSSTGPIVTVPSYLAITPGKNVNGVWVDPIPHLIHGKLKAWMISASVETARIPGYWGHKKGFTLAVGATPAPGEKVVYHLHGGGYIRFSAHPSDPTAVIAASIVEHTGSIRRSFSLEYRLSSSKPFKIANPFPAALLDALAGYNYLINVVGFQPVDIVVVGDSAGGNLAHALIRYLIEHSESNPSLPAPPGHLVLLSPWSDLSLSHERPEASSHRFTNSDYIHPSKGGVNYAKDSFLGPLGLGAAIRNPYISPSSLDPSMMIDFKGFPPTFIVAGGAEIFYDQIQTLKDRMTADIGDRLTYYEAPDAIHDYLIFTWHEPERTETLKAIAEWIGTPL